ncbi:complement factor H isoform X2 [Oryzias melastigma]|uniref:complement factor H isoform X2 n=1 Tax=Oryzias melastigma TaxID=30732 RepID=UPI00168D3C35|nr:complement factor H isoform X2 [Oryzias melastigma]
MPRITTICIPFLLLQALASVKCQVTECTRQQFIESSAYDKNFDTTVLQPTYPLKKQVKVPCRTGYTGFFKLVCSETGWETIGGPCQAKSCGHPGDAQFADFQLESGNDFVFASTVVYTCHKGYQMVSRSNRRRCMADGWDGHIPTCEAVKCESLPVNDNVQVSGDPEDGTYGNVIRFSCKSRNQILKGPTEIYCDESGEWSGNVPECKEVSCDTPQIPHGRVTDPPKLYRENEHLNFVCDNKYKPADDRRSRCLKVGSEAVWSPTPQCTLIQCKVNLPPIPGTRYNRYDKNMFPPGDTLTVTCDGDRWIVDMKTTSAVVTCNDNGNWDIIPECKDVSCDEDRRDRYLRYFDVQWRRRKMNDRATYSCKRGYEKPSGVTYATCTRDGWMPERLCEGTTCEKPDFEHGEQITSREKYSYNDRETLTYQCVYPTDIIPVTITCDRGSWSGIKSCLELACVKPKIPNGFAIGPHDNTVYYSCNQNYKLFSKAWWGVAKCSNGKWSTLQECIEITECGETPDISNGRVASIDKQRATITCSEGYQTEINEITCDNGEWDLDERNYTNVCTRISEPCDPPPQVKNAVIELPYQREYVSGSQVIYKCRDNYKLGNDKAIRCLDGQWEEKMISCTPFCKELEDSKLNVEQSLRRGEYMNGDTIDYRCAHAEQNEGTATCYEGKWNKTIECPGTTCEKPNFEHGEQITSRVKYSYNNGETLTYQCVYPTDIIPVTITCDRGSWSGFKSCLELACVKPTIPNGFAIGPHDNTVYYSCNRNYKLFSKTWWGVAKCSNGKWSTLQECIEITECGETPDISNGRVASIDKQRATITCNEGYRAEINETTCEKGEWDLDERNYTNVCRRISEPCGPPPKVKNAVIETPYQREYVSGSQVVYKCRDNYKLGNDKAIRCLDGLWEEKMISCTPFCKELEDSKLNVEQSLRRGEYMNGDTIDYRCAHAEQNGGTATCYEGKWNKTIECPGIPCNVPQLGPGLRTSPIISRMKSGGKLNVFCTFEYELEGENEIECLDTGLWSSTFPTCTKTCEMPDIPTILRLMTPVEGTRAKKGQKLEFECSQRGKFIQGNAEIECLESGEWSDQLPRCGDRRTCSAPPAIEFGDVMGSRTEYQEGESAEYTCPRYYLMEGGPWRTCRSGQWTGRVRCIKPCSVTKEEMDKHHLQLQKHWLDKIYSEHNDHLTFICKEGKRPDGRVGMRQQCVEGVIELPTCV